MSKGLRVQGSVTGARFHAHQLTDNDEEHAIGLPAIRW